MRRLTPWITTVRLMLAELVAEGQVRLADGTLIACANYPGCVSRSEFAGHAAYGYCPSKSQFIWGTRLVLLADPKGVPVGYDVVGPKTGQERDAVLDLAAAHPGSGSSPMGDSGAASTCPRCNSSTSSSSPRPGTSAPSALPRRSPRPVSGS